MKKSELIKMIHEELAKVSSNKSLTEAKVIKTQSVHKALEPAKKLTLDYISQLGDPKTTQELRNIFSSLAGLISDAHMKLGSKGVKVK